ncbi:MAG: 16S rRNA (adenine(1518)-N(6)/adenine(1519)-N(6))-dimethyltransferase RsmA [Smithellaceae bacterium]|nr:16S rRNA (adenine(1518)-N(6)/adenine(1519)-N(6))-dimethyltransferase RsmA [Smithellaceae bacterium]
MNSVKAILRRYNIVPKKSLGQSFLTDGNTARSIVELAELDSSDTVIEIGSGVGFMTRLMAEKAGRVIALELDRTLIEILLEELKDAQNIKVIHTDVLKYDFGAWKKEDDQSNRSSILLDRPDKMPALFSGEIPGRKIKVVGNIPYNISSPIIFQLLDHREAIDRAILMVQKEVADRLLAAPGTKEYGIPTVIMSMYAVILRKITVPPGAFSPPPKVTSTVIEIKFRERPLLELIDPGFFRKVVRTAFGMRRKTLFNNLRNLDAPGLSETLLEETLRAEGIDGRRRGETLSVEDFGRLSNTLFRVMGAAISVNSE